MGLSGTIIDNGWKRLELILDGSLGC